MTKDKHIDQGLFRLYVAIEDAVRFESLLVNQQIRFQSYIESLGDLEKVFVLNKSDSQLIESVVQDFEITTGHIDHVMISSKSVAISKFIYGAMAAVAILTVLGLLISSIFN